jgi:ATP/maltotriose-dependent transcriptional regulator MalT
VALFPNILLPADALKAYAPIVVKFWENQETALEDLKEFADGWFARRHDGMRAALEAAVRIRDAGTSSDILQEYQALLKREMELLAEDGKAYQQQVLKAGTHLSAPLKTQQTDVRRTG